MMIDENRARVPAVDDEPASTGLFAPAITGMSYLVSIASKRSRIQGAAPVTRRMR
jgi:hypothetical protein